MQKGTSAKLFLGILFLVIGLVTYYFVNLITTWGGDGKSIVAQNFGEIFIEELLYSFKLPLVIIFITFFFFLKFSFNVKKISLNFLFSFLALLILILPSFLSKIRVWKQIVNLTESLPIENVSYTRNTGSFPDSPDSIYITFNIPQDEYSYIVDEVERRLENSKGLIMYSVFDVHGEFNFYIEKKYQGGSFGPKPDFDRFMEIPAPIMGTIDLR